MFKTDIIKRYIFKPNYYKYEKIYNYEENLKIFNNNCILYLYISIYDYLDYLKIKQIKQNYIISFYFNHNKNKIFFNKIKNYDNTDIINFNDYYKCIFDLRISNDAITKKIDKDIFIIYYHTKYIIKDINIIAIRKHKFYNIKHTYVKFYISYYINYYIIIYNNNIKSRRNFNTIFCNFSRNFMLFI